MARDSQSLIRLLTYALNPKSFSISLRSLKSSPPTVKLDSLLVQWSLLSGQYRNNGSIDSKSDGKFNQIFTILFLTYYIIKILITMLIDDNSILLIYIGDAAIIFMNMIPRIYFHLFWITISLKSLLTALYYYLNENKSQLLVWLKPAQIAKG